MGVLSTSEVREARFGGDKYSIETPLDESVDVDSLDEMPEEEDLQKMDVRMDDISHENGEWVIRSKSSNKVLGKFKSKEEAVRRLQQIEWFKSHKGE
jgi:hypothetical protein